MDGSRSFGLVLAGVALSLLFLGTSAQGAVRKVPQQYPTIQAAVNAANPGDTIAISKKRNFEHVAVSTPRLVIKGAKRGVFVDGFVEGTGSGHQFDINANRVRIANLELRHGSGINCNTSDRCVASKVRFKGLSDNDCFYSGGNDARVLRSTLTGCGYYGVEIGGDNGKVLRSTIRRVDEDCIYITGNDAVVRNNDIRACEDGEGVHIKGGDNARVEGNRFANTGSTFVWVDGGDRAKVLRNRGVGGWDYCYYLTGARIRAEGNRGRTCEGGFYLSGNSPKAIANRIVDAESDAFEIDCFATCAGTVVKGNVARHLSNDGDGVEVAVSGSGKALIQNNRVFDVAGYGFDLYLPNGGRVIGNTTRDAGWEQEDGFYLSATNVTVKRNKAMGSGGDGFWITGDDGLFEDNVARNNHGDGFDVFGHANRLIGNVAQGNKADGIENEATDTVLRRNRASGNRRDCANSGTIAVKQRNRCADKSNFKQPGTLRKAAR
jgi:hypothetical protein